MTYIKQTLIDKNNAYLDKVIHFLFDSKLERGNNRTKMITRLTKEYKQSQKPTKRIICMAKNF